MKEYLEDFKQKREENKLSYSAYYNLLNTNRNISYDFSNKSGLISIIVATHNRVDQLSQLINSILKQTYQNFEIILIDDTSTDETNEIFGNFFDKRLKYYRNYENMGMGLNRQKAYNLSKGDYVIFCDDDDYFIDNTYFSDVVKIFKEYEDVNVICSECYTHYEKEDKYVPLILNLDEGTIDSIEYMENFMIKYKKPIVFPAFRRKNMIEAQFKEMTMMNDTSLYLRAFMTGGKAYINKKIIGIYRMHGENDTFTTKSDFIIKNLEEKRKIYEYVKEHKIIQNVDYWYAKQIAVTVNHYLRHVGDEEGIDNVLNWVWKNVSYDEYLKYKKTVLESYNLKLYYYKYPNVGDMLNEVIFSKLFNLNLEEDNFQTADLCAIGSILDKIFTNSHLNDDEIKMQNECTGNKPLHIWGTGLMYEYENINQKSIRPLIIHALRGENTRKRVSEIMGKEIECVLADPGLLAPLIVEAREKEWEVGIIPHYTDNKEEVFNKMNEYYPNSKIIDVQQDTEEVLKEISMCEYIISTSLHGLIFADAYGIPNCWCEISDRILGERFKFHDYFSSFGTDRECFDLRNESFPDINEDFKCNYKSEEQLFKKRDDLLNSFPF